MENNEVAGFNQLADLSHHNVDVDLAKAKQAGLAGAIHKATQGKSFVDPAYADRVALSRSLDILWGAYHFGTADPVDQQLDNFLKTIRAAGADNIFPCLDWESNPAGSSDTMSLEQAVDFVQQFHDETGIWPGLYGGYWMIDQLKDKDVPTFKNCPLWQAYYKLPLSYPKIWNDWTLWQYTDGKAGPEPHQFAGIGPVDRDTFNGDQQQLADFWKNNSLK